MTQVDQPVEETLAAQRSARRSLSLGVAVVLLGIVLNVAWLLALVWFGLYGVIALVR